MVQVEVGEVIFYRSGVEEGEGGIEILDFEVACWLAG